MVKCLISSLKHCEELRCARCQLHSEWDHIRHPQGASCLNSARLRCLCCLYRPVISSNQPLAKIGLATEQRGVREVMVKYMADQLAA